MYLGCVEKRQAIRPGIYVYLSNFSYELRTGWVRKIHLKLLIDYRIPKTSIYVRECSVLNVDAKLEWDIFLYDMHQHDSQGSFLSSVLDLKITRKISYIILYLFT